MSRNLTAILESALRNGLTSIGQIVIAQLPNERFELRHVEDALHEDLEVFHGPDAAHEIALTNDSGDYRPLKTAPNMRHGWMMILSSAQELRLALDTFYPAMLGVWASYIDCSLLTIPLRQTLGRQSGMYASTKRLTDPEAQALVSSVCATSQCLKLRLWTISSEPSEAPENNPFKLPLLCHEACNFFVAAARQTVKTRESQEPQ